MVSAAVVIRDNNGAPLNAGAELTGSGLVFHSRSGTDRNRDYRQALETMMWRLDQAGIAYEIYLDSRPVQDTPLVQRRLTFNRTAPVAARFDELVRAMNAGTASHGAWRRLLIVTPATQPEAVLAALEPGRGPAPVERLSTSQLRQVTNEHIHRAVARLLDGEDAPNFAPSRDYDVLTDEGVALAPKKVFGLALEEALGIEAFPGHFSAGWSQVCFELLEAAGLWIVPKAGGSPRPRTGRVDASAPDLPQTDEERSWTEGNPKIVSHLKRERQAGLAKQKKADFISQHGRLFCEACKLDPVERYGAEAGAACIEVHHHRVHVANMAPGHSTVLDDLQCLCASCHRVLHRKLALGLAASS